jgi:hypothetical protein
MLQRLGRTIVLANSVIYIHDTLARLSLSSLPLQTSILVLLVRAYTSCSRLRRPLTFTEPPVDTMVLTGTLLRASTVDGMIPTDSEVESANVVRTCGDVCEVCTELALLLIEVVRRNRVVTFCDVTVPACTGRRTFGMSVVDEFRAARGMSTLLSVAVETRPKDVRVTVSRLTDVTRLKNGPVVSMFPTKPSICKPGLTAKIMPSSQ